MMIQIHEHVHVLGLKNCDQGTNTCTCIGGTKIREDCGLWMMKKAVAIRVKKFTIMKMSKEQDYNTTKHGITQAGQVH